MKNAQLLFAFCICLFCSVIKAQQSESPRKKINFNREWKYAHGDVRGAERIGYNDSGWETVGVPHYTRFLIYVERFLCGVWMVSQEF